MALPAESFSAANVKPLFFEGERQEIALREAAETITLTGDEGQKFSGLYFNRDFASNLAIVRLGGMMEDVGSIDLRYTGYQIAAANPENPVIMINLPAHGDSDPLTHNQRREILKNRSLIRLANSQAMAVRSVVSTETDMTIAVGQSAGGRLAPDFVIRAAQLGLEPKGLLGISLVGLDKRPSVATSLTFIVDGYLAQRNYHQNANNQKLDRGLADFREQMARSGFRYTHNTLVNDHRIFRRDPSYIGFLLANSPLSDDGGFMAIESAMDFNPRLQAAFVSGALDKVTRWRKIESQTLRLTNLYPERLSWDVWPNDGHSMGIGPQQPRFAACVRAVIESLPH